MGVLFAYITLTLQFVVIFEIAWSKGFQGQDRTERNVGVWGVSLFLLIVLLAGKANEGAHKLVFTIRCVAGWYKDVNRCTAVVAGYFALTQFVNTFLFFGLSLHVLAQSESVLDSFQDFVT